MRTLALLLALTTAFTAPRLSPAEPINYSGASDKMDAGANNAALQAGMLNAAAQDAKSSGNSDSANTMQMMAMMQMMQAQKDKDKKKENEDNEKKSKEGDEDSKNKTVKWDLPKAQETKFEFKLATDDEYRAQRKQVTNSELETVTAGSTSTGPRSNEFVRLDTDPFILNTGGSAAAATGAAGGNGSTDRPNSNSYDKAPIEKIGGGANAGKPTKSELVPIAGELPDSAGSSASLALPQGAVGQPFAGSGTAPLVTGNPTGSGSTAADLGSAALGGEGHGGSANGGAGGGSSGGSSSGSRGIASFDSGGGRAGTLPIDSGSGGGSAGASGFGNFKSAEGMSLDGSPLFEGSDQPLARREKDINLFEYATYRLKKIAFTEKRVRTSKETVAALPPKQAGLMR